MTNWKYLAAFAVCCGIGPAQAAPDAGGFAPSPSQISALQAQADRLASSISAVIQSTEVSTKTLASMDREAAIQSAVQGAITASGDDPHVVLDTLQAFTLCSNSAGRYSVTQIPVTCADLKTPLSPEAREALASVEKVIVAMVDQSDAPGALGAGGRAPFDLMPGEGGSGGGSVNKPNSNSQANAGGQSSGNSPGGQSSSDPPGPTDPSVDVQPGPGGGGSSGYNTN